MARKIVVIDFPSAAKDKTAVWWKIGKYFINQENIRSVKRSGRGSAITLFHGNDLQVDVKYDELASFLPSDKNKI